MTSRGGRRSGRSRRIQGGPVSGEAGGKRRWCRPWGRGGEVSLPHRGKAAGSVSVLRLLRKERGDRPNWPAYRRRHFYWEATEE
ncbi:hypothetical protein chiPu_0026881 [Chiloscyllium punctatum]|uniref:Uncharacterized protein n=1 Tax=Chiloscyllium punctatum TaxID=137246 RepID=A0A401TJ47_CHIPU|nr:hypothetical protein [Chiloscyllium punctatum]